MTPQEIVGELDKHIVGQGQAKRAVAIALRNRWRRQQVEPGLRAEITPKNILMIGPTGVGKTEIARRLAAVPYSRSHPRNQGSACDRRSQNRADATSRRVAARDKASLSPAR